MSSKILVVDDKQMMRDSVAATLQRAGYQVVVAADGQAALSAVARHRPAAVVTDLKMPEMDGVELLGRLRQADDQLPVVLMTAFGSIDSAVKAMKEGAFDFIQKPFEGDQLVLTMRRAVEHRRLVQENAALKTNARNFDNAPALVGRSGVMRQLAQQIQQIAQSHGTVLISGESGTGKEVVARTVHAHSPRRDRVLLCLNCAALSSSLLESELFGHEKGAFTGADQLRKGRFELADGGTLLLDEISEISPQLQAKLLRVLQERQFERVGSSVTMQVDVRVIATTNRDLGRSVAMGEFRQDLYYRLNVLPIALPPLRQRVEDVALLAESFLIQVAMREGRDPKQFDEEAIAMLGRYSWPGNVRELQNICERAAVLTRGQVITAGMIQPWLTVPVPAPMHSPAMAMAGPHGFTGAVSMPGNGFPSGGGGSGAPGNGHAAGGYAESPEVGGTQSLEALERDQIVRTLGVYQGNRQRTAEALGIGVRTLGLKLKKWKELNLVAQTL
ncbi:MAG: sigma-54 dependent transcriptional regulator [Planctomycetota bacterium]|nr:sigma-54 dependent transcriptional regulator [Planctomycetota bacterium]